MQFLDPLMSVIYFSFDDIFKPLIEVLKTRLSISVSRTNNNA